MKLPAVLCFLALSACASAPASRAPSGAEPAGMEGSWKGTYYYPDYDREAPPPVSFELSLRNTDQGFEGKCREPNTFGDPSAAELRADIRGYFAGDGRFHFYKVMDGTGGVTHTIEYDGRLSADGRQAEGHWFIPGTWSGRFRIER